MIKHIIKLLLISLLMGSGQSHAQNQFITPYWVEQDSLFYNLSKDNIDVLYDRVHNWAGLDTYDAQTDTPTFAYTMQAWHELYISTYDRDSLMTSLQVREKARQNEVNGQGITVGYIDYEFHKIVPHATDSGYIVVGQIDSLWYDGITPEKAYALHRITLPVIASDKIEAGLQKFYFDPEIALDNVNVNQTISMKITSGAQSITLLPGQSGTLSIHILDTGRPCVKVEISIGTGLTLVPWYGFDLSVMTFSSLTTNECHNTKNTEIWSGTSLTFQG